MKISLMRISSFIILLAMLMLFSSAVAEFWAPVRLQTYQNTTYVSGGIGETELEYLESQVVREQYNLEILTAAKSGSYLSMARARVVANDGSVVLDVVMDGPILLTRLPPGRYQVTVMLNAETQVRDVRLADAGMRRVVTYWDVLAERLEQPEISPAGVRPLVPKMIDGIEVVTIPGAEGEQVPNGRWHTPDSERSQLMQEVRSLRQQAARLEQQAAELERSLK